MTRKLKHVFFVQLLLLGTISNFFSQKQQDYDWKTVPMKGGGFVPGVFFNETEKEFSSKSFLLLLFNILIVSESSLIK